MSNTTTTSWKMRIASMFSPCEESSSALSWYSLRTMAVLLRAMRNPIKIERFPGSLKPKIKIRLVTMMVRKTCKEPPMRTWRFRRNNSLRENSRPMVKRRRTTPISASSSTSCTLLTRCRPCGPTRAPVTRKPMMVGSFILWQTWRTIMASPKIMAISCNSFISMPKSSPSKIYKTQSYITSNI